MSNDLTTPQGVFDYLSDSDDPRLRRFKPRSGGVDELNGGNSNYVWRIWLDVPWKEEKEEAVKTVVLKHTKPFVRGWKELGWSTQRQVIHIPSNCQSSSTTY